MSTSTYVKRICKNCGKTFLHNNKYYLKKFCCLQCCTEYNKGKDRRIYTVDDNFLKKESFEKYYILGLYAADGCIYNKYEKGIHLSQSGEAGLLLVSYVKKLLRCSAPITKVLDKSYKTKYILHFNSKVMVQDFMDNEIKPKKTFTFKIPEYILKDENKLRYFLIGYIDGDGCVGTYHTFKTKKGISKTLDISFVCNSLMKKQIELLELFSEASICKNKNAKVWQILFNGRKAIKFGQWLYKDLHNNMFKSYKYWNFQNYMSHRYEITPGLRMAELRAEIQEYLRSNPEASCEFLQKYYKVPKRLAQRQISLFRKVSRYE